MKGLFVAFEGIEGSGKSTQIRRLAESLRAEGLDVTTTREPGGTSEGAELRRLILEREQLGAFDPLTEAFFMLADRSHHVLRVIRPALDAGRVVLCDRFTDSTLAYQGAGSGLDPSKLEDLNHLATGGLAPDLTLLLDLPVEISQRRVRGPVRGPLDRFELEPPEFHERIRGFYLDLAKSRPERYAVLDATRPEAEVAHDVRAAFDRVRARVASRSGGG